MGPMATGRPLYLDHLSTTPLDPRVLSAMRPYLEERFGNAASQHAFGREARQAVDRARLQVAQRIGASPAEIVFTAGATEAINLALKGTAEMLEPRGRHLVTVATEHRAVLDTCTHLEGRGFEVTRLPCDGEGRLAIETLAAALRPDTILVAVMWANNEVGTLAPVEAIGALCRERDVLFFCDASQAVGKLSVDVRAAGVGLLALSGHKLYGPKGSGALYVSRREPRVRLAPQLHGGGHERGLRSGTLDVPAIVGLGAACELAGASLAEEARRTAELRDLLEQLFRERLEGVERNGPREGRLPGCSNLSFAGVDAEDLLVRLGDRLAISSGSACSSATLEPSHVLGAMGLDAARVAGSLRFGLGRGTTREEVERAVELVAGAIEEQRAAR